MGDLGQSPLAVETLKAELYGPSDPLNHTWTLDPLDVDPDTGLTLQPGPLSVELQNTTVKMYLPENKYFLLLDGVNYTAVQVGAPVSPPGPAVSRVYVRPEIFLTGSGTERFPTHNHELVQSYYPVMSAP